MTAPEQPRSPGIFAQAAGAQDDLTPVNHMSIPDALVWYNRHGIAAYPAHPSDKKLLGPGGYHFDDLGIVGEEHLAHMNEIGRMNPAMRVAIILGQASGLIAIDVDNLEEWQKFLAGNRDEILPTAWQTTGREGGGLHLLYRRGELSGQSLRQGSWEQFPGIELKTRGLIMAAPSVHASGSQYLWHPAPVAAISRDLVAAHQARQEQAFREEGAAAQALDDPEVHHLATTRGAPRPLTSGAPQKGRDVMSVPQPEQPQGIAAQAAAAGNGQVPQQDAQMDAWLKSDPQARRLCLAAEVLEVTGREEWYSSLTMILKEEGQDWEQARQAASSLTAVVGQWPPQWVSQAAALLRRNAQSNGQFPAPFAPEICCGSGSGPETIRAVRHGLCDGLIPGSYVTDGRMVIVEKVGGSPMSMDGSRPLPVAARPVEPTHLALLLAEHTYTFKRLLGKGKSFSDVEFTPEARALGAALSAREWPGLDPLNGIVGAPVLRPDGKLLQDAGYDQATGLYLAGKVNLPKIPDRPADGVAWARDLVLDKVLHDFPWCGDADKANYLAMLVTQILRRYLGGSPVPFFPVTATDQSSGKTLLVTIPGVLYGLAKLVWPQQSWRGRATGDEEELRKVLTTVLSSQEGVITFDNIPEGTVIRSATLAKLLTDRTWGDRMLGGNALGTFANDRLWTATGNNLRYGGDMRSRSVLIAIDPAMPHPERRSGFKIPDLESWIENPVNQRTLLIALLILVADWAAAGCKEAAVVPFRQFTRWAQVCGGFLAHHGVEGFLANAGDLEDADDDAADWTQFLSRWPAVLGYGWLTSEQIVQTAGSAGWGDTFPTGKGGELLSAKGLGRRLAGQRGRYNGTYVLKGQRDPHSKIWLWWVEIWTPPQPQPSQDNNGVQDE